MGTASLVALAGQGPAVRLWDTRCGTALGLTAGSSGGGGSVHHVALLDTATPQLVRAPCDAPRWPGACRVPCERSLGRQELHDSDAHGPLVSATRSLAPLLSLPKEAQPLSHALTSDQYNIWTPRLIVWSGGSS